MRVGQSAFIFNWRASNRLVYGPLWSRGDFTFFLQIPDGSSGIVERTVRIALA